MAENVAAEAPADTVTFAGTVRALLSLLREMVVAEAAVALRATVQVLVPAAAIVAGTQASELSDTGTACTVTAAILDTLPSVAVMLPV